MSITTQVEQHTSKVNGETSHVISESKKVLEVPTSMRTYYFVWVRARQYYFESFVIDLLKQISIFETKNTG